MRRSVILAASAVLVVSGFAGSGLAQTQPASANSASGGYAAALADPVRTEADRGRDAARHAVETLTFAEVKPGQKVVDMIIGGGYFTRLFSAAVGPTGHVTAWQPAEFIGFSPDYAASITAAGEIANADAIRAPIGAPEFPTGVALSFTAQNYHDLHLKAFAADTAAKVNAAAFAALKPGGVYLVLDHYAAAGSGLTAADTLHRIDPEAVKSEVEAAGFVLEARSDLLANPADPLTANVFDASIRGHTSQFLLRFRKPV